MMTKFRRRQDAQRLVGQRTVGVERFARGAASTHRPGRVRRASGFGRLSSPRLAVRRPVHRRSRARESRPGGAHPGLRGRRPQREFCPFHLRHRTASPARDATLIHRLRSGRRDLPPMAGLEDTSRFLGQRHHQGQASRHFSSRPRPRRACPSSVPSPGTPRPLGPLKAS